MMTKPSEVTAQLADQLAWGTSNCSLPPVPMPIFWDITVPSSAF